MLHETQVQLGYHTQLEKLIQAATKFRFNYILFILIGLCVRTMQIIFG